MNVLKESFKFARKYSAAWLYVVLAGFILTGIQTLLPQIPALIIDRVINPMLNPGKPPVEATNMFSFVLSGVPADDFMTLITRLVLVMSAMLLFRYIVHYSRWNVSHYYGVKAEKDFRKAVFNKMLNQNSLVMANYTSGDLMSICNSDSVPVKDMWSQIFAIIIDQIANIVLAIYFLAMINAYLLIVPLILGGITAIFMGFYIKALRRCYNEIREAAIDLNTCIQENINGVRIIRSYATENIEIEKFRGKNENYRNRFLSQSKIVAKYNTLFTGFGYGINIGSLIIGTILAATGIITPGQFLTFNTYVILIQQPLIQLVNWVAMLQNGLICGNRMFTFLNTANTISDPADPQEIAEKPHLSMSNVSIRLDENEELKNITLDIPYGKKLGIMGKTGSGKSVMIKAFSRLFETTVGETMINGVNIKNYRVDDVRRQFGYVMQDVFLFSNTVDANIAFFNPDASHDDIVKAAKIAEADTFINNLEDGYDTVVGERGLGLSGGQKQRVSIARALLKDAPIILLDDATSALDMETERKILSNINENYSDRTVIIASHRASSVENTDEIIFLDDGEIKERGTHSELMAQKGRYYDIYTAQAHQKEEALS